MVQVAAIHEGRFRVTRIQSNIVARRERQLLDWLCGRFPSWIKPDHLTLTGAVGALVVLTSYIATHIDPAFLWLASLGLVIHWFGDSLDGSLARHRQIERPIYGYFLDHTVDAMSNLVIMAGIGFTNHVRMELALFALIGYYLLCIYVFINNHLIGVLQLSFMGFGPTELRLGLIVINILMFFVGDVGLTVGFEFFSIYDIMLFAMGIAFVSIFITRMIAGLHELREPDRETTDPSQSASKKPSRRAK